MDKLLSDFTVRRTAQLVILCVLTAFIVMELGFVISVLGHHYEVEWLYKGPASKTLVNVVGFPFQSEFGSFAPLAAGIVPLVFSSVCYTVDTTQSPKKATSQLNRTGHVSFLLLIIGIIIGLINILLSSSFADEISQLVGDNIQRIRVPGDDLHRVAIRNFFNSIMSFQVFYLLHLTGFQK